MNIKMTVQQLIDPDKSDDKTTVYQYEVKQTVNTVQLAIGERLNRRQLQYYCVKPYWTVTINS